MAKYCVNCGSKLKDDYVACPKCGEMLKNSKNSTVKITNNITTTNDEKSNGFAVAGFVVSLVSSLLCCGSFNMIGLILSIIGLVKAKELDGKGKGLAIAGIVISVLVIVFYIIFTLLYYGVITARYVSNVL